MSRSPQNTESHSTGHRNPHPGNQFPRPNDRVRHYPGTRIIIPPAWERCSSIPNWGYWRQRDLMGEIKMLSRAGFIPVSPIGDSVDMLTDYSQQRWQISATAQPPVPYSPKENTAYWR